MPTANRNSVDLIDVVQHIHELFGFHEINLSAVERSCCHSWFEGIPKRSPSGLCGPQITGLKTTDIEQFACSKQLGFCFYAQWKYAVF